MENCEKDKSNKPVMTKEKSEKNMKLLADLGYKFSDETLAGKTHGSAIIRMDKKLVIR